MTAELAPRPATSPIRTPTAPTVRLLRTVPDFDRAVRVLCEAFATDTAKDLVNTSLLVALEMSDNYVSGVFLDGEMVGAAVGWRGSGHTLRSHIVGIRPKHQSLGLGYELKMHQRRWAQERGLAHVRWTFDPLVRRNAHFNLSKLGSRVLEYREDLYGSLVDGLNRGVASDRLLAEWDITAEAREPRAGEHAADLISPIPLDPWRWDLDAAPEATVSSADGSIRLVLTPRDIAMLRLERPELAARWLKAVRLGLVSALSEGFTISGFTMDGCYVLRRP